MKSHTLLSDYSIIIFNYKNTHTTGNLISFSQPCIGYLKKGHGQFLYNGNTYYISPGDLVYIAAGTKYYSIWYGEPDIEFYSISFSFSSNYAYYEYRFQIIRNYPEKILDNIYNTQESSPLMSISYFYMLLDDIYGKMIKEESSLTSCIVQPAIEYIENNYSKPIAVETLALICRCSQSSLFSHFKKSIGVSPITYKHNVMIQHALDLIEHTSLSIEEISDKTGFSSANYFRRVFFKITGKTPKEVRQDHK